MLVSRKRDIVTPQSEHSRLAGMIALNWGNDSFDTPAIAFEHFLTAVTFHDRGYGAFDCAPIPDADEDTWLGLQRAGLERNFGNPQIDLLIQFHVRRLLAIRSTPKRDALRAFADSRIEATLRQHELAREPFEWADRITQLCDNIAFDFCFEREKTGCVAVCPRRTSMEEVSINYRIAAAGTITLDPWPLSVSEHKGFIVGYKKDCYPEEKQPVILPFTLRR